MRSFTGAYRTSPRPRPGLDLEGRGRTGYDVLVWLEAEVAAGRASPPEVMTVCSGTVGVVKHMKRKELGAEFGRGSQRHWTERSIYKLVLESEVTSTKESGRRPGGCTTSHTGSTT